MGQAAAKIFSGIAPEHYAKLTAKAQAAGIDLSGNSGTATKFGVEIAWEYSPEARQLTLHCLRTPFFVKPEDVYSRVEALVKESLG